MNLLLLVQNDSDARGLKEAAQAILNSAITGVWVVFSPAVTVDSSEAAAKIESEIVQLRDAERQAADRADYEAAKGYKAQREGKELDKAKAIRDAWKTAEPEARTARTKLLFEHFTALLNGKVSVRVTGHSDHYERDQWVQMLNSLSGVWFKPFTPGSFMVAWPNTVAALEKKSAVSKTDVGMTGSRPSDRENDNPITESIPKSRREELESKHHLSVRSLAVSLKIDVKGKGTTQIIDEILAVEAGNTAPAIAQ